jgi:hypothetical protein
VGVTPLRLRDVTPLSPRGGSDVGVSVAKKWTPPRLRDVTALSPRGRSDVEVSVSSILALCSRIER